MKITSTIFITDILYSQASIKGHRKPAWAGCFALAPASNVYV